MRPIAFLWMWPALALAGAAPMERATEATPYGGLDPLEIVTEPYFTEMARWHALSQRAGLQVELPDGWVFVHSVPAWAATGDLSAISADGTMLVRYSVIPHDSLRMAWETQVPGAIEDPNTLREGHLTSLLTFLTVDGAPVPEPVVMTPRAAARAYRADWAATASVAKVCEEARSSFHQAHVVAIHKRDIADAWIIVLHDGASKAALDQAVSTMKFLPRLTH